MSLTPTSSYSHFSTVASISRAVRSPPPLSTQQSHRYLSQRVKDLEQELEQRRIDLFASEEARADLEARVNVEVPFEGSAGTRHSSESNGEEQIDDTILTLEADHQQEISRLHKYYQGVIGQAEKDNTVLNEKLAQFNDLSDSTDSLKRSHEVELQQYRRSNDNLKARHEAALKRYKRSNDHLTTRHEAELKQKTDELGARHDTEKLALYNDSLSVAENKERRHKTELEQQLKEVRKECKEAMAAKDEHHEEAMTELQDVFQAELRLTIKDHEVEKVRLRDLLEVEHQAEIAELDGKLRTHEALVEEQETIRSAHQAEVEAMKIGYESAIEAYQSAIKSYETAIETYKTKLSCTDERQKQDLAEMKESIENDFATHEEELMRDMVNSYLGLMGLKKACLGRFGET